MPPINIWAKVLSLISKHKQKTFAIHVVFSFIKLILLQYNTYDIMAIHTQRTINLKRAKLYSSLYIEYGGNTR